LTLDEVLGNLFQKNYQKDELTYWEGGRVGEIIAESLRSFFLSIPDEKEAQKKQGGDLGADFTELLNKEYSKEDYGIYWGGLILSDIEIPEEIKSAEIKKREAKIKKELAADAAAARTKLDSAKIKVAKMFGKLEPFKKNPEAITRIVQLMYTKDILEGKPGDVNLFSGDISNLIPAKILGGEK